MPIQYKDVPKCDYPATITGAESRLVEMVMLWADGDYKSVIKWFRAIGCEVREMESGESWQVIGLTGVNCGLMCGLSAIDSFGQFGMIVAGPFWPQVFQNLPRMVDQISKIVYGKGGKK